MNIAEIVRNNGLKSTPARESLLEIFYAKNGPICYEDIKGILDMDKATFYRNMTIFEEKGIVNSFESNDKKRYYEIFTKLHGHFICSKCHNIECLQNLQPPNLQGHTVENVIVYGCCLSCQEKQNN